MKDTCKYSDCDKTATKKGYCNTHYNRIWRNGDLDKRPTKVKEDIPRLCNVEDCDKTHYANGLCAMHNRRRIRNKSELETKQRGRKTDTNKHNMIFEMKKQGKKTKEIIEATGLTRQRIHKILKNIIEKEQ